MSNSTIKITIAHMYTIMLSLTHTNSLACYHVHLSVPITDSCSHTCLYLHTIRRTISLTVPCRHGVINASMSASLPSSEDRSIGPPNLQRVSTCLAASGNSSTFSRCISAALSVHLWTRVFASVHRRLATNAEC
jgi:hypothetical protein